MRRLMLCTFMVLTMAMPAMALAQQGPYNDKQNPDEYTNAEDGQLLKVVSYFIAPIGFALEWGVARPLHYLATQTFLAPAMNAETREPTFTPPAIAEIPLDDVGDQPPHPSRITNDVRIHSTEETPPSSTP